MQKVYVRRIVLDAFKNKKILTIKRGEEIIKRFIPHTNQGMTKWIEYDYEGITLEGFYLLNEDVIEKIKRLKPYNVKLMKVENIIFC